MMSSLILSYLSAMTSSLGDDVIADKYDNMSDDELMKVLEDFQARQQSYAQ